MDRKPAFISEQVLGGARYFFLDLEPRSDVDLTVVCGGREPCTTDYEIDRSGFPFHVVEYVADGEGDLQLMGQNHALRPGSVFVYGPGIPHLIRPRGSRTLVKYFVCFAGRQASVLCAGSGGGTREPHQLVHTRWVHDIFDQLLDSGSQPKALAQHQCRLLLRLLLARLEVDAQSLEASASVAFATYSRCRRHIEEHFRQPGGAAEVAAACGIDPAYMSRLFRQYAQEGPYQLLLRLRMDVAADLLGMADRPVAEEASAVGYADTSSFNRVFKRVHGITPAGFLRSAAARRRPRTSATS